VTYSVAYPVAQFVSAPDVDADVRFDLNSDFGDAKCTLNADGFSLGAPTLDGDPTAVGAVYGERTLTLTPRLTGTKGAVLTALTGLSRELLRSENWFLFQLDEHSPRLWFKLYRSPPQPLSLDEVDVEGRNPDVWTVSLSLVADAMALGEWETIPAATITQAPSGTNPLCYSLPAIKGDAPTYLRVSLTPQADSTAMYGSAWLVGCVAGDDPALTVVDIGTDDVVEDTTNTSDPITDADYFGGSYRQTSLPLANTLATRILGTLPALAPGQYKALLRSGFSTPNAGLMYRLLRDPNDFGHAATLVTGDTPAAESRLFWVDLGESSFPFGVDPTLPFTVDMAGAYFELEIGAVDGAEVDVDLDAFVFIPVGGPGITSSTMMVVRTRSAPPLILKPLGGGVEGVFEGDAEGYWSRDTATDLVLNGAPIISGGFPIADPAAANNLLVVIAMENGWTAAEEAPPWITTLDTECTVEVSYRPRYLYVGDGS
jgi:hypothetical protein